MKFKLLLVFFPLLLQQLFPEKTFSQAWNFIKEKDGVKVYTRKEKNSTLKSFMGIVDVHASMEKVCDLIGNVKNVDWWDKNLKEIKVLLYEKDKHIQYYLVYGAPWPLTDRDLCVDAKISTDPVTGIRTIFSVPLPNTIAVRTDRVRITDYWQRWTIEPKNKGVVHLVLEGFVDPAGNVPDWIYNMVITETPLKIIKGIKARLEVPGS